MFKKIIYYFAILAYGAEAKAQVKLKPADAMTPSQSFYEFKMKTLDGKEVNFADFKGKKVLLVNTASECGYTPQYEALQALSEKYGDKLVVLGFPANDFGKQEPGTNSEIGAFCKKNYGVTFQIFEKIDVVGANKAPLYKWLSEKDKNGWNSQEPKWNFCKYLVDENGTLVGFYPSAVKPLDQEIVGAL